MNSLFKEAFNHMLQALTYWVAYKRELNHNTIIESDVVNEAENILTHRLAHKGYLFDKEYKYSHFIPSSNEEADLAIINSQSGKCECIIEFKLGDSTNGGYKKDVKKISAIKRADPQVECYVIIVYRKLCSRSAPRGLVTKQVIHGDTQYAANRSKLKVLTGKERVVYVKVRRVCKSISSITARKMFKTVCIELV